MKQPSILAVGLLFSAGVLAGAADNVSVQDAYVRLAPPNAPATGAFMVIRNNGDKDVKVVKANNMSWAYIAARMPEPHILFTVVQPAASGSPAPRLAWRAGAWPCPAGSTQPMMTSSTCSGFKPARSTAALIATLPSWAQLRDAKSP